MFLILVHVSEFMLISGSSVLSKIDSKRLMKCTATDPVSCFVISYMNICIFLLGFSLSLFVTNASRITSPKKACMINDK